jgi:hypothetical protein
MEQLLSLRCYSRVSSVIYLSSLPRWLSIKSLSLLRAWPLIIINRKYSMYYTTRESHLRSANALLTPPNLGRHLRQSHIASSASANKSRKLGNQVVERLSHPKQGLQDPILDFRVVNSQPNDAYRVSPISRFKEPCLLCRYFAPAATLSSNGMLLNTPQ